MIEEDVIADFKKLSISQKAIIKELIGEFKKESNSVAPSRAPSKATASGHFKTRSAADGYKPAVKSLPFERLGREPNLRFISHSGVALAIGDQVILKTTATTGAEGDIAVVHGFHKTSSFVTLTLLGTGVTATRHAKNLIIHKFA